MSIFIDPLLPKIEIPNDLHTQFFNLGSAKFQLLQKQYCFLAANEEFQAFVSGYGGGKTKIGAIKAAFLSMAPNNRGLVGMEASTDLDESAERDLLDFLLEAELLKEAPKSNKRTAIVHCIDPLTGKNLGYDSEISFVHLDDPKHVRGRHLGWFWIDEGSKVKREAWQNLIGRLRLPSFRNKYKAYVTGNPEGHNWIYDFFFNEELITQIKICGKPGCKYCPANPTECNRQMRLRRRAIHCTSYENYFLPPEYIENMLASFSEEERLRYLEGSFDVFEGQIFREFNESTHVFEPPSSWVNGNPPLEWSRLLACDVGGATPWAFEWCAVDPDGNLIFYDEICRTTGDVDSLANEALPKMKDENGNDYKFTKKIIDYENKVASEDLKRRGIVFTNAQKMNKNASVQRFRSYLHPNAKHHFPDWHPLAGQPNSPRVFFSNHCRNLRRELPQQRWKENVHSDDGTRKDEMDRNVRHDTVDCALYICRELPDPTKLKPKLWSDILARPISTISKLYWCEVAKRKAQQESGHRKPYRAGHDNPWQPKLH